MTATWAAIGGGVKHFTHRGWWLALTAVVVVGVAGLVASNVMSPDKGQPASQASTAPAGARSPHAPVKPPAAKPAAQKPPGKADATRKVAPVPPLASGIPPASGVADLVSAKGAAWLALGAVVMPLGLLARRRKHRPLAIKLGLLALVAAFLWSGAPGVNLTIVGIVAAVVACCGLLAMLGSWSSNQPVIVFVKAYAAKQALRGIKWGLFFGLAAVLCFSIAAGEGAGLAGLLVKAHAAIAELTALVAELQKGMALRLIEGLSFWSLLPLLMSSTTYGQFFIGAALIGFGWAVPWLLVAAGVAILTGVVDGAGNRRELRRLREESTVLGVVGDPTDNEIRTAMTDKPARRLNLKFKN